MAEPANQDAPVESQRQGGSVLTRKYGPLPMWAWVGLALGILVIASVWSKNKKASQMQTPDQTTAASQIPQFVNQVYTQTASPNMPGPPGPVPPEKENVLSYRTNGKQTLADIAKQLHVDPNNIIANTIDHPGNVNRGKFTAWLHSHRGGSAGRVPAGFTLFYTKGGEGIDTK